jgi:glutathione S-transferase
MSTNSSKAILHYFNGRGKAEIIRLIMAATGVEWEFKPFTEKSQYTELLNTGKLLFSQTPFVEYEGKELVQTNAIAHFFAAKGKLMGSNVDEEYKINALYDGTRDLYGFFLSAGFDAECEEKAKTNPKALPRYLPVFNRTLKENAAAGFKNGFLVGDGLTLADLGLFECVLCIEELIGADYLKDYPEIQKFSANLKSNTALSKYLASPLRTKANDETYCNQVKTILSW